MSDEIEIDDRIEKMIWRGLGRRSVRQMAQDTGLSIEKVAYVRTQLLESVDDLTIQQQTTKLLHDLREIADQARDDYYNADDTDSASKLLQVAVGAIKTVLDQLNRIEKGNNTRVTELNELRVRELLRLIDRTVDATLAEIAGAHDLDLGELNAVFQSHLVPAAEELEA